MGFPNMGLCIICCGVRILADMTNSKTKPRYLSATTVAPFTDDEIAVLWATSADPASLGDEATSFVEFVAEDVTDRLLDWLLEADADDVAYHCRVDGRALADDQFVVGCDPDGRWWLSCPMIVDDGDDLLPPGMWDVVAYEPCDVVTVTQVTL